MLARSAVDRGFKSQSEQIKDYISCCSANSTALRSKSKDGLDGN
jgi:hypothetical protein